MSGSRLPEAARVVLAGIRLVNGTASLFAPATFTRKLGADPETNGPTLYVLRMFGVRTILIGSELLSRNPDVRAHALRLAVRVHLTDAIAAAAAGATRQLPAKGAKLAVVTSSVNTALAMIARKALR